ncbi:hypothetical protein PHYBOEH_002497 [Phytophthora boehmeriae]|uniref:VPS9 domain-containing protein n=1 Tax=Phytophthora boehmeriae TaxID=109152 RepID=A0A8T1WS83_9STRA|nr:hypothetical protein PHYBOEH_002497 [Phytophthora boehmeriae]
MAAKRRQSIEVFRLRLRETVNEGDDSESAASGSARSLMSLPEQDQATNTTAAINTIKSPSDGERMLEKTSSGRVLSRQELLRRLQQERIDEEQEAVEEDIDGRDPSERQRPPLMMSLSSGDSSSRTMRCSLDAAENAAIEVDIDDLPLIEDVAKLDGNSETTEANGSSSSLLAHEDPEAVEAAEAQAVPPSKPTPLAQTKDNARASRRVVLVTRPSQRDIEMWTERATSTMVKSAETNARPTPTSAQSRRWVLEYKPVVRHSGWLIKRGHGLRNFKRRLFCIVDNELIYHDTHDATEVRGRLDLNRKSTVQCLLHSGFKFVQGTYSMVLYATDNHDRDVWIRKLQEHNVQLLPEGSKTTKLIKQNSDNADKGPILFSGWLRKRGRMIEERVFFPLYRVILANVRAQTREDSKVLKGKIEILRSKSQSFFGIGPDSVSSSKWASACVKLREVDKVSLPYMKRAQLLAACKEIYAVFHVEHPTQAPMSADAFIPAFIFVLIHSHLRDPVALKELITFFDAGSTRGEIAYFVTCLEIALEYIRSLLTACTVVLSSSRKLGIEFSKHPDADVVVVHRLVPGEQAQQSGAINIGDVLVAVNGLPVYEMELAEVVKLWRGVDGEAEFCFLPMDEYLNKYGTS